MAWNDDAMWVDPFQDFNLEEPPPEPDLMDMPPEPESPLAGIEIPDMDEILARAGLSTPEEPEDLPLLETLEPAPLDRYREMRDAPQGLTTPPQPTPAPLPLPEPPSEPEIPKLLTVQEAQAKARELPRLNWEERAAQSAGGGQWVERMPFVGAVPQIMDSVDLVREIRRLEDPTTPLAEKQALSAKLIADTNARLINEIRRGDATVGAHVWDAFEQVIPLAVEFAITAGSYTVAKEAGTAAGLRMLGKMSAAEIRDRVAKALPSRLASAIEDRTAQLVAGGLAETVARQEATRIMTPMVQKTVAREMTQAALKEAMESQALSKGAKWAAEAVGTAFAAAKVTPAIMGDNIVADTLQRVAPRLIVTEEGLAARDPGFDPNVAVEATKALVSGYLEVFFESAGGLLPTAAVGRVARKAFSDRVMPFAVQAAKKLKLQGRPLTEILNQSSVRARLGAGAVWAKKWAQATQMHGALEEVGEEWATAIAQSALNLDAPSDSRIASPWVERMANSLLFPITRPKETAAIAIVGAALPLSYRTAGFIAGAQSPEVMERNAELLNRLLTTVVTVEGTAKGSFEEALVVPIADTIGRENPNSWPRSLHNFVNQLFGRAALPEVARPGSFTDVMQRAGMPEATTQKVRDLYRTGRIEEGRAVVRESIDRIQGMLFVDQATLPTLTSALENARKAGLLHVGAEESQRRWNPLYRGQAATEARQLLGIRLTTPEARAAFAAMPPEERKVLRTHAQIILGNLDKVFESASLINDGKALPASQAVSRAKEIRDFLLQETKRAPLVNAQKREEEVDDVMTTLKILAEQAPEISSEVGYMALPDLLLSTTAEKVQSMAGPVEQGARVLRRVFAATQQAPEPGQLAALVGFSRKAVMGDIVEDYGEAAVKLRAEQDLNQLTQPLLAWVDAAMTQAGDASVANDLLVLRRMLTSGDAAGVHIGTLEVASLFLRQITGATIAAEDRGAGNLAVNYLLTEAKNSNEIQQAMDQLYSKAFGGPQVWTALRTALSKVRGGAISAAPVAAAPAVKPTAPAAKPAAPAAKPAAPAVKPAAPVEKPAPKVQPFSKTLDAVPEVDRPELDQLARKVATMRVGTEFSEREQELAAKYVDVLEARGAELRGEAPRRKAPAAKPAAPVEKPAPPAKPTAPIEKPPAKPTAPIEKPPAEKPAPAPAREQIPEATQMFYAEGRTGTPVLVQRDSTVGWVALNELTQTMEPITEEQAAAYYAKRSVEPVPEAEQERIAAETDEQIKARTAGQPPIAEESAKAAQEDAKAELKQRFRNYHRAPGVASAREDLTGRAPAPGPVTTAMSPEDIELDVGARPGQTMDHERAQLKFLDRMLEFMPNRDAAQAIFYNAQDDWPELIAAARGTEADWAKFLADPTGPRALTIRTLAENKVPQSQIRGILAFFDEAYLAEGRVFYRGGVARAKGSATRDAARRVRHLFTKIVADQAPTDALAATVMADYLAGARAMVEEQASRSPAGTPAARLSQLSPDYLAFLADAYALAEEDIQRAMQGPAWGSDFATYHAQHLMAVIAKWEARIARKPATRTVYTKFLGELAEAFNSQPLNLTLRKKSRINMTEILMNALVGTQQRASFSVRQPGGTLKRMVQSRSLWTRFARHAERTWNLRPFRWLGNADKRQDWEDMTATARGQLLRDAFDRAFAKKEATHFPLWLGLEDFGIDAPLLRDEDLTQALDSYAAYRTRLIALRPEMEQLLAPVTPAVAKDPYIANTLIWVTKFREQMFGDLSQYPTEGDMGKRMAAGGTPNIKPFDPIGNSVRTLSIVDPTDPALARLATGMPDNFKLTDGFELWSDAFAKRMVESVGSGFFGGKVPSAFKFLQFSVEGNYDPNLAPGTLFADRGPRPALQRKSSAGLTTDQSLQGYLKDLADAVETWNREHPGQEIDRIVFESTRKVGRSNPARVIEDGTLKFMPEAFLAAVRENVQEDNIQNIGFLSNPDYPLTPHVEPVPVQVTAIGATFPDYEPAIRALAEGVLADMPNIKTLQDFLEGVPADQIPPRLQALLKGGGAPAAVDSTPLLQLMRNAVKRITAPTLPLYHGVAQPMGTATRDTTLHPMELVWRVEGQWTTEARPGVESRVRAASAAAKIAKARYTGDVPVGVKAATELRAATRQETLAKAVALIKNHPEFYGDLIRADGTVIDHEILVDPAPAGAAGFMARIRGEAVLASRVPADAPHSMVLARLDQRLPDTSSATLRLHPLHVWAAGEDFDVDIRYTALWRRDDRGRIVDHPYNTVLRTWVAIGENPANFGRFLEGTSSGLYDNLIKEREAAGTLAQQLGVGSTARYFNTPDGAAVLDYLMRTGQEVLGVIASMNRQFSYLDRAGITGSLPAQQLPGARGPWTWNLHRVRAAKWDSTRFTHAWSGLLQLAVDNPKLLKIGHLGLTRKNASQIGLLLKGHEGLALGTATFEEALRDVLHVVEQNPKALPLKEIANEMYDLGQLVNLAVTGPANESDYRRIYILWHKLRGRDFEYFDTSTAFEDAERKKPVPILMPAQVSLDYFTKFRTPVTSRLFNTLWMNQAFEPVYRTDPKTKQRVIAYTKARINFRGPAEYDDYGQLGLSGSLLDQNLRSVSWLDSVLRYTTGIGMIGPRSNPDAFSKGRTLNQRLMLSGTAVGLPGVELRPLEEILEALLDSDAPLARNPALLALAPDSRSSEAGFNPLLSLGAQYADLADDAPEWADIRKGWDALPRELQNVLLLRFARDFGADVRTSIRSPWAVVSDTTMQDIRKATPPLAEWDKATAILALTYREAMIPAGEGKVRKINTTSLGALLREPRSWTMGTGTRFFDHLSRRDANGDPLILRTAVDETLRDHLLPPIRPAAPVAPAPAAKIRRYETGATLEFRTTAEAGYTRRTEANAAGDVEFPADATIDFTLDPTLGSGGARGLTRLSVLKAKKLYIPVQITQKGFDPTAAARQIVDAIKLASTKKAAFTVPWGVNIAGHELGRVPGLTQEQMDQLVIETLTKVQFELAASMTGTIKTVRTGGQTGFDEAGAKAGIALGRPTLVLAPAGWPFRPARADVLDEAKFKQRFPPSTAPVTTSSADLADSIPDTVPDREALLKASGTHPVAVANYLALQPEAWAKAPRVTRWVEQARTRTPAEPKTFLEAAEAESVKAGDPALTLEASDAFLEALDYDLAKAFRAPRTENKNQDAAYWDFRATLREHLRWGRYAEAQKLIQSRTSHDLAARTRIMDRLGEMLWTDPREGTDRITIASEELAMDVLLRESNFGIARTVQKVLIEITKWTRGAKVMDNTLIRRWEDQIGRDKDVSAAFLTVLDWIPARAKRGEVHPILQEFFKRFDDPTFTFERTLKGGKKITITPAKLTIPGTQTLIAPILKAHDARRAKNKKLGDWRTVLTEVADHIHNTQWEEARRRARLYGETPHAPRDAYIYHLFDDIEQAKTTEQKAVEDALAGGLPSAIRENVDMFNERKYDTYAEAIAQSNGKLKPKTLDVFELMRTWTDYTSTMIRNRVVLSAMASTTDISNRPAAFFVYPEAPARETLLFSRTTGFAQLDALHHLASRLFPRDKDLKLTPIDRTKDPWHQLREGLLKLGDNRLFEMGYRQKHFKKPKEGTQAIATSFESVWVLAGPSEKLLAHVTSRGFDDLAADFPILWRTLKFLKLTNMFSKEIGLGLSFFHHLSLWESYIAALGPNPMRNLLNPKVALREFRGMREVARRIKEDPKFGYEMSLAGLDMPLSNPNLDKAVSPLDKTLKYLSEQAPVLGRMGKANPIKWLYAWKKANDRWLWEVLHPVLKVQTYMRIKDEYQTRQALGTFPQIPDEVLSAEVGSHVNKAFGGQLMEEFLWATPLMRDIMQLTVFAPDWTIGALRSARIPETLDAIFDIEGPLTTRTATNLSKEQLLTNDMPGYAVMVVTAIPMAIQMMVNAAFGDDDDKHQFFMWMNEPGHEWEMDLTPVMKSIDKNIMAPLGLDRPQQFGEVTGMRRLYVHAGKQFRENFRWFQEPVKAAMVKSSIAVKILHEQVFGQNSAGWEMPWVAAEKAGDDLMLGGLFQAQGEFSKSRSAAILKYFWQPMSVESLLRGQAVTFALPVSRGMSGQAGGKALASIFLAYSQDRPLNAFRGIPPEVRDYKELTQSVLDQLRLNGYIPNQKKEREFVNEALGNVRKIYFRGIMAELNKTKPDWADIERQYAALARITPNPDYPGDTFLRFLRSMEALYVNPDLYRERVAARHQLLWDAWTRAWEKREAERRERLGPRQ